MDHGDADATLACAPPFFRERAGKIPLNPPFSKGEFARRRVFPLFEKEGQGAILDKCAPGPFFLPQLS